MNYLLGIISANHTKPINDRSKFKINKNFKTSVSSSTNFIPATSTPYTSKFKMNHKTITIPYPIRNVTPVNSSQYKYSPSCNQYIKSQSLLANGNISNLSSDVNTNKNKYKISNVTEENKFKTNSVFNTSENKFKFVKNPTSQVIELLGLIMVVKFCIIYSGFCFFLFRILIRV